MFWTASATRVRCLPRWSPPRTTTCPGRSPRASCPTGSPAGTSSRSVSRWSASPAEPGRCAPAAADANSPGRIRPRRGALASCRHPDAGAPSRRGGSVIDVELPSGRVADEVTRGFAACLASVTEVPVGELPLPVELGPAVGAWRTWLAERGSGLVPIAHPGRFQWPGWWIATVDADGAAGDAPAVAVLAFGTPPGVVLSPQAPGLLGRATADLRIRAAYAVASLDPVIRAVPSSAELRGTVAALAVASAAEAPMQLVGSRAPWPAAAWRGTVTPRAPGPSARGRTGARATTSPSWPPRSSTS